MAAAEARAAWQRSANRSFFSDEVKAHLFSGCSSSSTDDLDHATPACILHGKISDPVPKTKWWLDLQPKNEHKDFTHEKPNSLEVDFEVSRAGLVFKDLTCHKDYQPTEGTDGLAHSRSDGYSITERPEKFYTACMNNRDGSRMQELKSVPVSDTFVLKSKEVGEFHYLDNRSMQLDFLKSKKLSYDFESDWLKVEKNEPWWRTADKEELVSFVTQKSLEHIENCDLPPPQAKLLRRGESLKWDYFGCDSVLSSSIDPKTDFSSPIASNYAHGSSISVHRERIRGFNQSNSSNSHTPDGSFSCDNNQDESEVSEDDLSRAKLVEALCHSQTRAREAEKAAELAYSDKERIVALFFRQAAELFAYRQWLQLLQLENFCLQRKNKNNMISTVLPIGLPSMSYKTRPMGKGRLRAGKRKHCTSNRGLRRCAFAVAVGLSLAGAGLLFGWSMGWLFPSL